MHEPNRPTALSGMWLRINRTYARLPNVTDRPHPMQLQLRTLRRQADGLKPIETSQVWIDATSVEQGIVQAALIVETTLSGGTGVAMLTSESGALIWSIRKGMPKPIGPGDLSTI